jgi:hypothetical protein
MLVLLPTYKRLDSLKLVIDSILRCDLPILPDDEIARLVIINNYFPNKNKIEELIEIIKSSNLEYSKWEIEILTRNITLPPVENWYSAVFQMSKENEIIFFVCDDDLLTKDSLKVRYNALIENNATMVFGKLVFGLFYLNNCKKLYLHQAKSLNKLKAETFTLDYSDIFSWTSIHLSNHAFVFNQKFQKAYLKALSWCENQKIASEYNRKLFITYYIPIALLIENGNVIGINSYVLYRGMSISEIRNARYSIRSWNIGYAAGLAYEILGNQDLKENYELNRERTHFYNTFKMWYYAIKVDPRISSLELKELETAINFNKNDIRLYDIYHSITKIIKYYIKIQALPIQLKSILFAKKTDKINW